MFNADMYTIKCANQLAATLHASRNACVFLLVGFILSPHIYTYTEVGNYTLPPHPMAPPVLKVIIYFSIVLCVLLLYLF